MANVVSETEMYRPGTGQNSCATKTPVLSHYNNGTEIFPLVIVNVAHVLDTSDKSKGLYLSMSDFGGYQISSFN